MVRIGSDTGVSASVWCAQEALGWLRPTVTAALVLLLAGTAVLIVASKRPGQPVVIA